MLDELYIENIAVIEKAWINFNAGFNVLTGETGAGKSIIIGAINAILGGRVLKEFIRAGEQVAFVSASFSNISGNICNKLKEYGYENDENDSLILQRKININGKNSCYINNRPVSVTLLKDIGKYLINVHGQHESYGLLSDETHIKYIDNIGNISKYLKEYQKLFLEIKIIKEKLLKLKVNDAEKERKADLLKYQIDEIESAGLIIGEFENLTKLKQKYLHSERITTALAESKDMLNGKDEFCGALALIQDVCKSLEVICEYDEKIKSIYDRVSGISFELEDVSYDLSKACENIDFDPFKLQEIEQRLDTIYKTTKKYGKNAEESLEYLEKCKKELNEIACSDDEIKKLEKELLSYEDKIKIIADKITEKRNEIAKKFSEMVRTELEFLDMPSVKFMVSQSKCELNMLGQDKIEFLISTNPGQPPKPISKIASGGELSRIMLAIKSVLAEKDDIDTLIFDEVDTGIGGSAAYKVGLKLYKVSKNRQVICITHKAQIAAISNNHFFIEKSIKLNKTYTNVKKLTAKQKEEEIARMLGGIKITEATLKNAKEMIEMSNKIGSVQTRNNVIK